MQVKDFLSRLSEELKVNIQLNENGVPASQKDIDTMHTYINMFSVVVYLNSRLNEMFEENIKEENKKEGVVDVN